MKKVHSYLVSTTHHAEHDIDVLTLQLEDVQHRVKPDLLYSQKTITTEQLNRSRSNTHKSFRNTTASIL